ncbi:uroporphyrinogen-III C-methyltransferase [Pyxidicoccus fallax]|uniref:uroporphyrinogen-III C-methyltransferase n=1 Tax=Pyxidicoccus fallax TaxID=394095 RepID=A0A848LGB5_9BACT|nr:uroporphyrinogen-III C-methyltransferase [Pyxidicoccus fallax]NPC79480.1 uroporphyrinogen-III C-methyltransferase [Pyxidicoccus fallax]
MRRDSAPRLAVTGSASTGKTALARALSGALSLPLVPEEMRAYLMSTGTRLEQRSPAEAARALEGMWRERLVTEDAQSGGFVADNCVLDFAAYALHHGCASEAPELLAAATACGGTYDAIFLLPHGVLPYEQDGIRSASPAQELRYQLVLEALLRRHVPASRLIEVPARLRTVDERVAFCLEALAPRTRRRGPLVSLVGAGPGDPGLLTLRAREVLASADVIAYDALVAPAVLASLPSGVERVSVGHRNQGAKQAGYRIHPAVLEHARAGRHVARLKQGDPFIFGRGGEEAEELLEAGIPFEVVPGVSAALGAAAYAGIPLTHREYASDVTFVTGHDIEGPSSHTDWARLGAAAGTLVLYMATRKLAANLARLVACGKAEDTPAAYVAAATTPEQTVVVGTLASLAAEVEARNLIGPPALVVVGEVVRLRERLRWFEDRARGLSTEVAA